MQDILDTTMQAADFGGQGVDAAYLRRPHKIGVILNAAVLQAE
jgi:hypothetical protein